MKTKSIILIALCILSIQGICQKQIRIDNLNYVIDTSDNTAIVGSNVDAEGDVIIPSIINYGGQVYKVLEIGKSAFAYPRQGWSSPENEKITSITLSEGLKFIGESAFASCSNLRAVAIPNSVIIIENGAFSNTGLTSIKFGSGLKSIGASAFLNTPIQRLSIPNSVSSLGRQAFGGCRKLEAAIIGNGVETIPESLFTGCKSLKSIRLGSKVKTIRDFAFWECESLTDILLPESLTSIGNAVFNLCNSLVILKIPANVRNMSEQMIPCCKNFEWLILTSKEIPYSGNEVYKCPKYKGVKFQ